MLQTVVLPSGEVITTRARSRKSSAGPDLTRLFLGSEGTLGVIVAATLRLAPMPNHQAVGVSSFPSSHAACAAARDLLAQGVGVQCVELLDDVMLRCVNKANQGEPEAIVHEEKPSLFIKFAGATQTHVGADEKLAGEILARHGGGAMKFATEPAAIERLWKARKVALWSALAYPPENEGPGSAGRPTSASRSDSSRNSSSASRRTSTRPIYSRRWSVTSGEQTCCACGSRLC